MRSRSQVLIGAKVYSKDGVLLRELRPKRANSLLKQFAKGLKIHFQQANETVKQTSGADISAGPHALDFKCVAAQDVTNIGIVIGTGTTAVTMTDYKLEAQVTTNVAHSNVSFGEDTPDASTYRVQIIRTFTNNTGAALEIREVGLYSPLGGYYYCCIDRTLYSVDLAAGQSVTLTYYISISL